MKKFIETGSNLNEKTIVKYHFKREGVIFIYEVSSAS